VRNAVIIDSRTIPPNKIIDADVCIVGAGVAGISVAREFYGNDVKVCVLESGGMTPDRATQSLLWGENTGQPYYPLDTARVSAFGGSSNRWIVRLGNKLGVRLRPLDAIDFQEREWVPDSGWPFTKAHLDPYYERAQSICKIGPYTYDTDKWENPPETPRLPFVNGRGETAMFQFGTRDVFIRDYREVIKRSENIVTYIHAHALRLETDEYAQTVTGVSVAGSPGTTFRITAKIFILALGAIDTPRLLLLSDAVQKTGLGNQHDLVGRYFMEHPHLWSGYFIPENPKILDLVNLYKIHEVHDTQVMGKLTLSEEVLRKEKLLNYVVSIHPVIMPGFHPVSGRAASSKALSSGNMSGDLYEHVHNVVTDMAGITRKTYRKMTGSLCRKFNICNDTEKMLIFRLNHMTEQAPNRDSRVTLSDERDMFARNRVRLHWQLQPMDIRSIVRAQEIIDEELRRAGLGRLVIEMEGEEPPPKIHGGWHHMGTTRMHADPSKGVVDEHCKVHGVSNLYIAGPSVFPTGGYANPVLTIVALSARLADHVKKQFAHMPYESVQASLNEV